MPYKGLVKDRLQSLPDRTTKYYSTYKEAHDAAESLCKRTLGARGTVEVTQK